MKPNMTRNQSKKFFVEENWKDLSSKERVLLQMCNRYRIIPLEILQEDLNQILNREVMIEELSNKKVLQDEIKFKLNINSIHKECNAKKL